MRIALVHDWLNTMGGAERVLLALSDAYPDAPIFTSVYNPSAVPAFQNRDIRTSFLQRIPFARTKHQLFPAMRPLAFESFDLSEFDIVISSASAEAKGVITKPETCHICYCHTPTRYYWSDYHAYRNRLQFGILNPFVRTSLPRMTRKMRIWDYAAAQRVDAFIANSNTTAQRIQKFYHRESEVIHPPVDTDTIVPSTEEPSDYFLVVSRIVPYKRIDIVIDAFNELQLPLKIVGTGPEHARLMNRNTNPRTEFVGAVSEREKMRLYQQCRGFVFPTEEDAGITPLEAMAAGRPVIALRKGGAQDTVVENTTGIFFDEQTPDALIRALRSYDPAAFKKDVIRAHAEQYSTDHFQHHIRLFVDRSYEHYQRTLASISI